VLASEGSLVVITRNQRVDLRPERDGTTSVLGTTPVVFPVGTRVEISFGSSLPADPDSLSWARTAIRLGRIGQSYTGKPSPWWYDLPQFRELLYATGDRPVRELVANLDGCTGAKAGEVVAEAGLGRALCEDVTNGQAERLLRRARANAREVKPSRLGTIGPEAFQRHAYASALGSAKVAPTVSIPYVVEAWAVAADKTTLQACVNRTPVTGNIFAKRDKRDIDVFGCGLHHRVTLRRIRSSISS
jgi:hypothetical protein